MVHDNMIYLDNAATTFPKPDVVYQAMDNFYRNFGGNAGRGANPLARKAAVMIEETRALLEYWLNAPTVVFTPSATIALNTTILGAGLRGGDVVYVTPFEHNSILRPLEHLRKTVGIQIKIIPFDRQTYDCKLNELKGLFKLEPPAMICMTQVSNVIGLITPVDEVMQLAKASSSKVITVVDGAQAAGLLEINMAFTDALIFSGHKSLYGPYGVAGIAFGSDWRPQPLILGGTGTQSESIDMPHDGPSRFEAGSHNISAIAGLNASVKWQHEIGRAAITTTTTQLVDELCKNLEGLPGVTIYLPGNKAQHTSIVSFSIETLKPQIIETALGAENIAVRAGLHCSPWAHEFINTSKLSGTVRLSVGYFNSSTELMQILLYLQHLL